MVASKNYYEKREQPNEIGLLFSFPLINQLHETRVGRSPSNGGQPVNGQISYQQYPDEIRGREPRGSAYYCHTKETGVRMGRVNLPHN